MALSEESRTGFSKYSTVWPKLALASKCETRTWTVKEPILPCVHSLALTVQQNIKEDPHNVDLAELFRVAAMLVRSFLKDKKVDQLEMGLNLLNSIARLDLGELDDDNIAFHLLKCLIKVLEAKSLSYDLDILARDALYVAAGKLSFAAGVRAIKRVILKKRHSVEIRSLMFLSRGWLLNHWPKSTTSHTSPNPQYSELIGPRAATGEPLRARPLTEDLSRVLRVSRATTSQRSSSPYQDLWQLLAFLFKNLKFKVGDRVERKMPEYTVVLYLVILWCEVKSNTDHCGLLAQQEEVRVRWLLPLQEHLEPLQHLKVEENWGAREWMDLDDACRVVEYALKANEDPFGGFGIPLMC